MRRHESPSSETRRAKCMDGLRSFSGARLDACAPPEPTRHSSRPVFLTSSPRIHTHSSPLQHHPPARTTTTHNHAPFLCLAEKHFACSSLFRFTELHANMYRLTQGAATIGYGMIISTFLGLCADICVWPLAPAPCPLPPASTSSPPESPQHSSPAHAFMPNACCSAALFFVSTEASVTLRFVSVFSALLPPASGSLDVLAVLGLPTVWFMRWGLWLLLMGVYFGVLGRDSAEVCTHAMLSAIFVRMRSMDLSAVHGTAAFLYACTV